MNIRKIGRAFAAATAVVALSCESSSITGLPKNLPESGPASEKLLSFTPKPLVCPASTEATTTAEVGPLGGLVSAGGTSISIPAGALLQTVTLTVTVPASNYMEIDISVAGADHFIFESPVVVTVSYARCNRSNIDLLPLTAWHFDTETRALLERMPSVDDKLTRSVTFVTGHLSGYILAN